VWLKREKTLEFYDLTSTDILEYRKKHTPMKFLMADGSAKKMVMDASLEEIDLVEKVCEKLGLPNSDEYCLTAEENPEAWLSLEKPLSEQLKTTDQAFTLKRRFYFFDEDDTKSGKQQEQNALQTTLMYCQAVEEITAGRHNCDVEEAVKFAAMQQQADIGDFNPAVHGAPGYVDLSRCLPPPFR
jgi:FERM central domain